MSETPCQEPAVYRSLFILGPLGQTQGDHALPNQLAAAADAQTLLEPAFGVLTVHEQVWRQKGLVLGNLLQSMCLAPGEVTRVAITQWKRSDVGIGSETAEQAEAVSDQVEQSRAVNEVQRAVATETQRGTSSVFAASGSARLGCSGLFWSGGASATSSKTLTAQQSFGSRNLAAESSNAISQSTAERSQALRSRRQSVVREVSEQEDESMTTRIVANYNRRHTMNVLYFEVLQTYDVKTRLRNWDRCLFVPMVPFDFEDSKVVEDNQAQLSALFAELGATDMMEHLKQALAHPAGADTSDLQQQYVTQIGDYQKALVLVRQYPRNRASMSEASARYDALKKKWDKLPAIEGALAALDGMIDPLIELQVRQPAAALEVQIDDYEDAWRAAREYAQAAARNREYEVLRIAYPELPAIDKDAAPVLKGMIDALLVEKSGALQAAIPGKMLNAERLFLSQQIWLGMNPYQVYKLLGDCRLKLPGCSDARPLWAVVDPQPVGVFGTYLAFRWSFGRDEGDAQKDFEATYVGGQEQDVSEVMAIPTPGIFSEAVLGASVAAEKIDQDFAGWSSADCQIPILPPNIADLESRDRAKTMDLTGRDFAATLAQLRAGTLSDASYVDKILAQAGNGAMFRDMGGLEKAIGLAGNLATLSTQGAKEAQEKAVELQSKVLDTFKEVLTSDAAQAIVSEYMVPGAGNLVAAVKKGKAASA
jgi:hypothetical protein